MRNGAFQDLPVCMAECLCRDIVDPPLDREPHAPCVRLEYVAYDIDGLNTGALYMFMVLLMARTWSNLVGKVKGCNLGERDVECR